MRPWRPRHWLILCRRIAWALRLAWSGTMVGCSCEHDPPCYLSPYVWDEEEQDHVLPTTPGTWRT